MELFGFLQMVLLPLMLQSSQLASAHSLRRHYSLLLAPFGSTQTQCKECAALCHEHAGVTLATMSPTSASEGFDFNTAVHLQVCDALTSLRRIGGC
jgi:hypothetical protein